MISGSGWRGGVEREDLLLLSQQEMALCVILTASLSLYLSLSLSRPPSGRPVVVGVTPEPKGGAGVFDVPPEPGGPPGDG